MELDLIVEAVVALMIALGVIGFIYGISNFTSIRNLNIRIEQLEDKIRRM